MHENTVVIRVRVCVSVYTLACVVCGVSIVLAVRATLLDVLSFIFPFHPRKNENGASVAASVNAARYRWTVVKLAISDSTLGVFRDRFI